MSKHKVLKLGPRLDLGRSKMDYATQYFINIKLKRWHIFTLEYTTEED